MTDERTDAETDMDRAAEYAWPWRPKIEPSQSADTHAAIRDAFLAGVRVGRADEREACALLADAYGTKHETRMLRDDEYNYSKGSVGLAAMIRARG